MFGFHYTCVTTCPGVSVTFGPDVIDDFLQRFGYDLIVRAHQVVKHGYEFIGDRRQLVTLFSAPN